MQTTASNKVREAKNVIESSKESEVLKKMNERQKCMILGRDFNYRLDSMERGNSLFEFLISSNLLCINDNKKVTYEYQRGKRVTDFFPLATNSQNTLRRQKSPIHS